MEAGQWSSGDKSLTGVEKGVGRRIGESRCKYSSKQFAIKQAEKWNRAGEGLLMEKKESVC